MAAISVWVVRWARHNITDPLMVIIRRGAEPKTMAMSGALGITLGIFPIYGVTALMCGCAIAILGSRCNAPTMMLANVLATPLELSLAIPFLRLGEYVVGGKHLLLSKDSLWKAVTGRASVEVLLGLSHAFLGWLIAAPVVLCALYFVLLPIMRFSIRRYGSDLDSNPLTPLMKDPVVYTV